LVSGEQVTPPSFNDEGSRRVAGDVPDPTRAAFGRAGDGTADFAAVADVRRVSSVIDGFAEVSATGLTFFYFDVRLIRVG
jgi:hypothetical protein